jgi:DEAD/DEAH box helicase domain-containing protein
VVRKAIGYKKIKFYTQENLGWGDILLPEDTYHTQSTWFTVPPAVLEALELPQSDLLDALHGIAHLVHGLASLLLMCDGRDLGVVLGDRSREWFSRPARADGPEPHATPPDRFEPTIFLYDQYSGGIGLAEALHPRVGELLAGARGRLAACPCATGCPSCVGPEGQVGPKAKAHATRLLAALVTSMAERPAAAGA